MKSLHHKISLWLCGVGLFGVLSAFAGDWSPAPLELARYEQIWKSTPFVAATEVTPQAESLAQRYGLTGFARVGERDVVFLLDRKGLNRFAISRDSPQNGVELLSVQDSGALKQLTAKIRVGAEVAIITYDAGSPATAGGSRAGTSNSSTPEVVTTPSPSPATASNSPAKVTRTIPRGPIKGQ